MNPVEGMYHDLAIAPASANDGAFSSRVVDREAAHGGGNFLVFVVAIGAIAANIASMKVMTSDVKTDATTLGGTPDEVLDVSDVATLPTSDDDNKMALVVIDLKAPLKKFFQLQVTAGAGATLLSATAAFLNVNLPGVDLDDALFVARG